MPVRPFVYATAARFGDVIAQRFDEECDLPAWLRREAGLWGLDRWGIMTNGARIRSGVAKLIRLENVSVQRSSLGMRRYHVVLEDGICARESYNVGPWLPESLTMKVGVSEDTAHDIAVHLMDDIPIGARISDPVVLISHNWQDNYAHTILETASRFWAQGEWPRDAGLLWEATTPAQAELQKPHTWLTSLPAERTLCRELYLPSFRAPHCVSPAQIDLLRRMLMRTADPDAPRRIYISRADTNVRRVQNERALVRALEAHGFVSLTLTVRTMAEQAALFRNAEIVVAPHGAGLVNTLFAEHARVVELVPDGYQHPIFGLVAHYCEHDYRRVICTAEPKTQNMFADVGRVMAAVSDETASDAAD